MNRAERRRAKKQGKPVPKVDKSRYPFASPPRIDIKQIKQEATREVTDLAFRLMLSVPCIAMNRYWGFGKKRCGRLMDQCLDIYKEFSDNELTIDQMMSELERLGGITITDDE